MSDSLHAPHTLAFEYTRSVGPVIGRFLTGLRDGHIEGIRGADAKVLVPPQEADPFTGEDLHEWVEVADGGTVTTWAWVPEPKAKHPLQRPFAWALIRLDGADSALLHVVDAGDEAAMSTGMRVKARWAAERTGGIRDIEAFEPDGGARGGSDD